MAAPDIAGEGLPSTMSAAQACGAPRYFTGRPCKRGHIAERIAATGNCTACVPAARRATRQRHPEHDERRRAKMAAADLRPAAPGETLPRSAREALAAGLLHYRSAKPCKRGHDGPRFTRTGNCVACHSEVHSPRWRCDNPEAVKRQQRKWRAENPDKANAKARRWYVRNGGAALQRARRAANPTLNRAYLAKRRAMLRAGGTFTAAELLAVLRSQRWRCGYCRTRLRRTGFHADHITPLARGGRNVIANIQALCPTCNVSKGARDPVLFARSRGLLI